MTVLSDRVYGLQIGSSLQLHADWTIELMVYDWHNTIFFSCKDKNEKINKIRIQKKDDYACGRKKK